jgi:hypothetical protein
VNEDGASSVKSLGDKVVCLIEMLVQILHSNLRTPLNKNAFE